MIKVGALIRVIDMPQDDHSIYFSNAVLLLHMAASYGVELFLFSHKDIDLKNNTLNGLFVEDGKLVRHLAPIPPIVDNKTAATRTDKVTTELFAQLKERTSFTRNFTNFAKWGQYERLSSDSEFSHLVIPTRRLQKDPDLRRLCDELGDDLILKPENSSRGRGIVGVRRAGGGFEVIVDDIETRLMAPEELKEFIGGFTENYIAQTRVDSTLSSGRPFDVRILVQRKDADSHAFVMYPRIGGGRIKSNLAAGGRTMPIDTFLAEFFCEMADEAKAKLEAFARTFPPYFQKFLKYPFFDMGLDIGIERVDGSIRLRLFEVNQFPNFSFKGNYGELHYEIARATLACYRYLHGRLAAEAQVAEAEALAQAQVAEALAAEAQAAAKL